MKKYIFFFLVLMPLNLAPRYVSQNGQDEYIHTNFFPDKKNGVCVEIGAHNGIKYSNSYFLSK